MSQGGRRTDQPASRPFFTWERTMRATLLLVAALSVTAAPAAEGTKSLKLTVSAGKLDRINTPVTVAVPAARSVTLRDAKGTALPAQLTSPGLLSKAGRDTSELHFILTRLKAGETTTLTAELSDAVGTAATG